jgi:hypothetical protein
MHCHNEVAGDGDILLTLQVAEGRGKAKQERWGRQGLTAVSVVQFGGG